MLSTIGRVSTTGQKIRSVEEKEGEELEGKVLNTESR